MRVCTGKRIGWGGGGGGKRNRERSILMTSQAVSNSSGTTNTSNTELYKDDVGSWSNGRSPDVCVQVCTCSQDR